jgi:hypothetical protein
MTTRIWFQQYLCNKPTSLHNTCCELAGAAMAAWRHHGSTREASCMHQGGSMVLAGFLFFFMEVMFSLLGFLFVYLKSIFVFVGFLARTSCNISTGTAIKNHRLPAYPIRCTHPFLQIHPFGINQAGYTPGNEACRICHWPPRRVYPPSRESGSG